MVNTLGVARNLRADDAIGVGMILGTTHSADTPVSEKFHIQSAR